MITPDANFVEFSQTLNALFKPTLASGAARVLLGFFSLSLTLAVTLAWPTYASFAGMAAASSYIAYLFLCQEMRTARRKALFHGWKSEHTVLTFSANSIATRSEFGAGEITWNSFNRLVETKDTYMLIGRTFSYVCIPKRNIPNDRSQEFVRMLREKVVTS